MDNHATTRTDPRVLDRMLPCFTEWYGNAASRHHSFGWQAEELVRQAREEIAGLIGAQAQEIVFSSGATESINLALKGVAASSPQPLHLITAVTEHKAVLEVCAVLERHGWRVTRLPVDSGGMVDPADLEQALTSETRLVSIMAANNEIGVLQPVQALAQVCRRRGVVFHTDATQAIGKVPFDLAEIDADLVSFSAHKMYGPKGVGALVVRRRRPRIRLAPLIDGGGHEAGLRSGTLNVPGIVGFGEACRIAREEMAGEARRLAGLRDRLEARLREGIEDLVVNGHQVRRLPHSLNVSIPGLDGDALVAALSDVALSSGAACASADPEPSHVLRALGRPDDLIRSSLRFGLGRFTTDEEVEYAAGRVVEAAQRLRRNNGVLPAR